MNFENNDDVTGTFRTYVHEQDKVWEAEDTHTHTHTLILIGTSLEKWWRGCENLDIQSNHQSSFCVIFII